MGDKIKKIYAALVDGAEAGHSDTELFRFVMDACPKATNKKIVKASLLALSDDDLTDANILRVIYALAIKHRLDPATIDDVDEGASSHEETPKLKKKDKAKKSEGHVQAPA